MSTDNDESERIAIIGVGCKFPKCNDPDEYWSLILSKENAIEQIPSTRWNLEDYYDIDYKTPGKMWNQGGGFVDNYDLFAAETFNVTPREAIAIDPQHRLAIEVAYQAIEYAGIAPMRLNNSRTAVYMGICSSDYSLLMNENYDDINAYSALGNASCMVANRISHCFNLRGPSVALDAACASSLVAVHQACNSLKLKECDLAIAGGVNLILSPSVSISFTKARLLSKDSQCKSFDKSANGYVRSEGCGIVILKLLKDAIRDSNEILAVIQGSAVNHDGKTPGIVVPSAQAQEEVILAALQNAKIHSSEINYIEAHGTGTAIGDKIESKVLSKIYGNNRRTSENLCAIGSVKSNIGHLEAAAGIAGLIKGVLSLKYNLIPPNINIENPLNEISSNKSLYIPTAATPWPEQRKKNIAISSFGFGGTNCHMIISEYIKNHIPKQSFIRETELFTLSSNTEESLFILANQFNQYLNKHPLINLKNLSYTTQISRATFTPFRLSIITDSIEDLRNKLTQFVNDENNAASLLSTKFELNIKEVVVCFEMMSKYDGSLIDSPLLQNEHSKKIINTAKDITVAITGNDLFLESHENGSLIIQKIFNIIKIITIQYAAYKFLDSVIKKKMIIESKGLGGILEKIIREELHFEEVITYIGSHALCEERKIYNLSEMDRGEKYLNFIDKYIFNNLKDDCNIDNHKKMSENRNKKSQSLTQKTNNNFGINIIIKFEHGDERYRISDDMTSFLFIIARLYVSNIQIDFKNLDIRYKQILSGLPITQFKRTKFNISNNLKKEDNMINIDYHSEENNANYENIITKALAIDTNTWEIKVSLDSIPYLIDHKIDEVIVIPGVILVDFITSLAKKYLNYEYFQIEDIEYHNFLIIDESSHKFIRIKFTEKEKGSKHFKLTSNGIERNNWLLNVTGKLSETKSMVE